VSILPEVLQRVEASLQNFHRSSRRLREFLKSQPSVRLEFTQSMPIFVGPPFRTSLSLPQRVGALTNMLVERAAPIFLGSSVPEAVLFPKKVGAFSDGLLQASFRF
jgi:hypothetical protein